MDAVNSGAAPWETVDASYRRKLDEILPRFGLSGLPESDRAHLNRVWDRSSPGRTPCPA